MKNYEKIRKDRMLEKAWNKGKVESYKTIRNDEKQICSNYGPKGREFESSSARRSL